ncbi:chaperone protein dnaJ C76, chloroplastic [Mercurialis annua]|uniref:chaperone protein dnaJ C76, chloroplastic n=1 Tax=Mercurialis annua TaxID=3986 RepID=UPI00215FF769|nr:chaperone protein dnaJ C76, chloroplastic [Mercurialis annua]
MGIACIPSYTPIASVIPKKTIRLPYERNCRGSSVCCKSSIREFDLYDLLGIDSCSDQTQIKIAYRNLQKKCHPDIAGPTGHDMAIILNQAYSLLSDPVSRFAYDKEQSKISELRGYSGKPIYSVWFGSESEEKAVFVDEVKCVGCLKCALLAEKTFAVEGVYGRARVVGQWADPLNKIQAAIEACPVDCISMVERSDLPALEFLMSKQPRGNVRVGANHTAGQRVSNIFVDVKKFQTRFVDAMNSPNFQSSKETDVETEARLSAMQAIRRISSWLYWQTPKANKTRPPRGYLPQNAQKSSEPNIKKLREAAATRKQGGRSTTREVASNSLYYDDYWTPSAGAVPASTNKHNTSTTVKPSHIKESKHANEEVYRTKENQRDPVGWRISTVIGIMASVIVELQVREEAVGRLNEHVGGDLALEVVNSSWLQVTLAGITWYIIAMAVIQLVQGIRKRA